MLKVYVGQNQANKQYENSFFRSFANTLSAVFQEEQRNGILIGHPSSIDDKDLMMDCLLITQHSLLIIEFKKRDQAIIHLPREAEFRSLAWQSEDRKSGDFSNVAAGNALNPFDQVSKQQDRLRAICQGLSISVPIHSTVIFQGDVTTTGQIPGKYQGWFSIADGTSYVEAVKDAINIRSTNSLDDFTKLLSRFKCFEYKEIVPLKLSDLREIQELGSLSKARQKAQDREERSRETLLEAERSLARNRELGLNLEEAQIKLLKAQQAAELSQQAAREALQEFDDKKNALETAKELTKAKEFELHTEGLKRSTERSKLIRWGIAVAALIAIAIWAISFSEAQSRSNEEALQLSYLSGNTCIPVTEVDQFIDAQAVCIVLTVNDVFDRKGYVVLKSNVNRDFQIFFSNPGIITEDVASEMYEGKTIEIKGDVSTYKDVTQMKVSQMDQIKISPK